MTFTEYLEQLSREHALIRHSDAECHFSSLADEQATRLSTLMHFPCVGVDRGGFLIKAVPGRTLSYSEYAVMFLQHVSDSGDTHAVLTALGDMYAVACDFLARMMRDRKSGSYPELNLLSIEGTEGYRLVWRDSGLFGWMLMFVIGEPVPVSDCRQAFEPLPTENDNR